MDKMDRMKVLPLILSILSILVNFSHAGRPARLPLAVLYRCCELSARLPHRFAAMRHTFIISNFEPSFPSAEALIKRMGLFWRRKKEDRFVTPAVTEAGGEQAREKKEGAARALLEPPAGTGAREATAVPPAVEPVPT